MAKDTSEIAKLTERISKDPRSKLFVPLAEEYKKMGDLEMAIHVLSEGLKSNPGYVTARSFLGRLLLEQGDFAASQHEFEEVVKAIPDNLLAQRKLGDLHLLQGRQEEALKHYKAALALNPGDAEIASLLSDIEAGVDVRARIMQPKSPFPSGQAVPPSSQPSKPIEGTPQPLTPSLPTGAAADEPVSAVSPEPAPEVVPSQAKNELVLENPVAPRMDKPVLPGELPPDGAQPPGMPVMQEEAEEVLVVEPLENEETPGSAPKIDFFSEKVFEVKTVEEPTEAAPAIYDTVPEEPTFPEAEADELIIPDSNEISEEGTEPVPAVEEQPPIVQTGADDFTTDTLAELYIAQGFFEKAIDIYQRMLADNPSSRGLREKLQRVREMATPLSGEGTAPAAEAKAAPEAIGETALFAEPQEYVPSVEGKEEEITIDAELYVEPQEDLTRHSEPAEKMVPDIFAEPREWTVPSAPGTASDEIFLPPLEETTRAIPPYTDFEPREYIPPTEEHPSAKEEAAGTAQKSKATPHKATVDRLEHWLSNIKKEK